MAKRKTTKAVTQKRGKKKSSESVPKKVSVKRRRKKSEDEIIEKDYPNDVQELREQIEKEASKLHDPSKSHVFWGDGQIVTNSKIIETIYWVVKGGYRDRLRNLPAHKISKDNTYVCLDLKDAVHLREKFEKSINMLKSLSTVTVENSEEEEDV